MSVITKQMREAIGAGPAPSRHAVEAGAVRRFAAAVDDPNPLFTDERAACASGYAGIVAPPTFTRTMRPSPAVPEFRVPYSGVLDAGSRWRFFRHVTAGDTITVTTTLLDLYERNGSLGNMLFAVRETTFALEDGQPAVVELDTEVYYDERAAAPGPYRDKTAPEVPAVSVAPELVHVHDAAEGMALPSLEKRPTLRQLVMYAGASGDFYELHYDRDFAVSRGFSDVVVHGALKSAFLGQLVSRFAGDQAMLRTLEVQYRGIDFPNAPLLCRGVVTERRVEDGETVVDCDVWTTNEREQRTTKGTALLGWGS